MRNDLLPVVVAFPSNLMATAQSPLTLPTTYARELTNMIAAPDGSGTTRNGLTTVGASLGSASIMGVFSYQHTSGLQVLVVTDAGGIFRLNGGSWVSVYSGLNGTGTPRAVLFGGKLVLCNGIDPILVWDGATMAPVQTLVRDAGANLTMLSATQLRIDSTAALYPVGSDVRVRVNGAYVTTTVAAVSQSGAQTTVTLASSVLVAPLTEVWFAVRPPAFANMRVAHDRLWGFGKGPLNPTLATDVDRLRVFYTFGVNDPAAWPDTATGSIPSINLADKAGVADELLAMAVKDGMTVFLGRMHVQLWEGSRPQAGGDFGWVKTIPLGVVHGDAVLDLPNDLLLVTRLGARTLSRTVQTEQLDIADVGKAIDPTLMALMREVEANVPAYRRLAGFSCPAQQWFGLAMGSKTLVWQVAATGQGWAQFDGGFANLTAAHTAVDGTLYVAKGNQLYRYDTTVWSDAGVPFTARWWTPWVAPAANRRWANKMTELLVVPTVGQSLTLRRYKDFDDSNGQVLNLVLPNIPDYWDTATWDAALWDNSGASSPLVRDPVVAEVMALCVETNNALPLRILGVRFYGLAEQRS